MYYGISGESETNKGNFQRRNALPQLKSRKDLSNLSGKKTFCKVRRQGDFFLSGKKQLVALENI